MVHNDSQFPEVLQGGIQAWLELIPGLARWPLFRLGVPYLDLFEEQAARASDPRWAAWMIVRYAELLAGYALFVLADAANPRVIPTATCSEKTGP